MFSLLSVFLCIYSYLTINPQIDALTSQQTVWKLEITPNLDNDDNRTSSVDHATCSVDHAVCYFAMYGERIFTFIQLKCFTNEDTLVVFHL
jgi:hypothetical protein